MTRVQVNGDRLSPNRIKAGTNGSYHETLCFEFSSEWTGLHCKAVFYPVRGKPVEVVWAGKAIKIPPEVMRYSGDAKYVVSGFTVAADGTLEEKIITLPGIVEVDATLKDDGGESVKQTPTVYEQLHANMEGDIAEAIEGAIEAEPDRFRGETGKAARVVVVDTETVEPGEEASVRNTGDDTDAKLVFTIPRGETGVSGVIILEEGESIEDADIPDDVSVVIIPTGESLEIVDGKDGKGFTILGFFSSAEELDFVDPSPGDAYGVGTGVPYDVYVYDGNSMMWKNIGAMNGIKGDAGRGIDSIVSTGGSGTTDDPYKFLIKYTDDDTSEFPAVLTNGKDGADGANGKDGADGNGISEISWKTTAENGSTGQPGETDTYTLTYTNGGSFVFNVYNGKDGVNVSVSTEVTEDDNNAVSSAAVYAYISDLVGDFEVAAAKMDGLIGGTA